MVEKWSLAGFVLAFIFLSFAWSETITPVGASFWTVIGLFTFGWSAGFLIVERKRKDHKRARAGWKARGMLFLYLLLWLAAIFTMLGYLEEVVLLLYSVTSGTWFSGIMLLSLPAGAATGHWVAVQKSSAGKKAGLTVLALIIVTFLIMASPYAL